MHDRLIELMPQLKAYAFALVRDRDRAGDLVQETAARALAARNVPADARSYRAWLFAILRNAAIDLLRHARLEEGDPLGETSPTWPLDDSRVAIITVRQALATLTPEAREILALVDVAGFTYAEASEFLDVPVGTVMSRLSRARAALLSAVETTTVHPLRSKHGR